MMMWTRGKTLGKGASAVVSLAAVVVSPTRNDDLPSVMAVKSAPVYKSRPLLRERMLLTEFGDCPHILRCFGEDLSIEDGEEWYNILLEYAAGGSLADRIHSFGRGGLPQCEVSRYAKSVLLGLSYIHKQGYVHCDIKPHNILLVESDHLSMTFNGKRKRVQEITAKIADLGLAKKAGQRLKQKGNKPRFRGTALYMAPESILHEEYEPQADIWALGCTVLQLITGKEPWRCHPGTEAAAILFRIGFTQEVPEIPCGLSKEAQDFLKKCLVRDPKSRWTADMLLRHPFVSAADGAFIESIKEERNRVVIPKAAKAVPDSSLHSSFNLPKPYLLMSHSASDGLIPDWPNNCFATRYSNGFAFEDFGEFPACKMQKRMDENAEQGLSRTTFRLDALGQYWGIKRISEIPNSNIAIEIFN